METLLVTFVSMSIIRAGGVKDAQQHKVSKMWHSSDKSFLK